jgi:hypothetical protein
MSVHWSGSRCLAIGGSEEAARRDGKVAVLDPLTRELTAVRAGTVEVRVTNESMRVYSDEASLEPFTTARTVRVPGGGGPPRCAR